MLVGMLFCIGDSLLVRALLALVVNRIVILALIVI